MTKSKIIKIDHLNIIDTSLQGKSKLIQILSYLSNLAISRTTRTVENILFAVRGSEQAHPITWLVDLGS